MLKIILASQSPRRKQLLKQLGIEFDAIPDSSKEVADFSKTPEDIVKALAEHKCMNIAKTVKRETETLIIGADTIVYFDGTVLGKPTDKEDAFRMLKALSGNTHNVYTGICVYNNLKDRKIVSYESTEVIFDRLSDDEIKKYIETGDPLDKAGAYGIQGIGALLIKKINGDYFNVVGLPINKLGNILKQNFNLHLI